MSRAEDIVDLIDTGLQTAMPDPTFGEVSPVNVDECWRCKAQPDSETGLCAACRAYLLEDTDVDPKQTTTVIRSPIEMYARSIPHGAFRFHGGPLDGEYRVVDDPFRGYRVPIARPISYVNLSESTEPLALDIEIGEYRLAGPNRSALVMVWQGRNTYAVYDGPHRLSPVFADRQTAIEWLTNDRHQFLQRHGVEIRWAPEA